MNPDEKNPLMTSTQNHKLVNLKLPSRTSSLPSILDGGTGVNATSHEGLNERVANGGHDHSKIHDLHKSDSIDSGLN